MTVAKSSSCRKIIRSRCEYGCECDLRLQHEVIKKKLDLGCLHIFNNFIITDFESELQDKMDTSRNYYS